MRGRPTRPLDAREQRILERVRSRGRITNADARTLVDVADVATMRRVLRRMVRGGLLLQRGTSKRHTYYEIGPDA
jgi:predicted MarR family transcription regulator